MSYLLLIFGVIIGSIAQIPLKMAACNKGRLKISYFINRFTVIGYILMIISSACGFIAVRNIELKYSPIIEATGYIYILLISHFVFHEKINKQKVIASFIIVLGIVTFSWL